MEGTVFLIATNWGWLWESFEGNKSWDNHFPQNGNHWPTWPSVCFSLKIHIFLHSLIHPSIYLITHLAIRPSICLSIHPFIYPWDMCSIDMHTSDVSLWHCIKDLIQFLFFNYDWQSTLVLLHANVPLVPHCFSPKLLLILNPHQQSSREQSTNLTVFKHGNPWTAIILASVPPWQLAHHFAFKNSKNMLSSQGLQGKMNTEDSIKRQR